MSAKTSDWRPGPTVCRCCLSEGCYKDISTEYFWMGKREVYAEMLSDTLDLSIAYSKSGPNSNSRLICEPCISRLRDAHDFKRQVLECEKTFMQHLDPGSESVQKEMELSFEEVKLERVKQEKKVSDDEDMDDQVDFVVNDDSDDDLDNEPLMKLATKVPKKEKEVDLLDLLDSSQITVKRKSTASTSKAKEPPAKKAKKREITIKPSASKATASKAVEKKKKGIILPKKIGEVQNNAAVILESSNVTPFRYNNKSLFGCAYCSFTSPDFGPIKIHTKEHKDRSLTVRNTERSSECKVDVTGLKCDICQETMKDLSTLFEHLIEIHNKHLKRDFTSRVIPFLLENGFTCADCGVKFDVFQNLNCHMKEHYSDSICSDCGRGFMNKTRLKAHVKWVHNKPKKPVKCSNCNETFPTVQCKRKHIKSTHKLYDHKCPYCTETFKSHRDRVLHLNKYHGRNINYPCPICSKVFESIVNRSIHLHGVHLKDKQIECPICGDMLSSSSCLKMHMVKHSGEKKYQCEVCKKAYARKKTLTEHMRIHNNDKRFVCVHCGKAFVQKGSLKGHVKTYHPEAGIDDRNSDVPTSRDVGNKAK